jgi:ribosome-binding factor A
MNKAPSQRQLRVGEQVRHALSDLLLRGELRDPELDGLVISVTEVAMSPDLRIATAYVSPLGAEGPDIVTLLQAHARFIRGRLSPALRQLRYMPEIRFRLDSSFENFEKIERLLRSPEVARDLDSADEEEN